MSPPPSTTTPSLLLHASWLVSGRSLFFGGGLHLGQVFGLATAFLGRGTVVLLLLLLLTLTRRPVLHARQGANPGRSVHRTALRVQDALVGRDAVLVAGRLR